MLMLASTSLLTIICGIMCHTDPEMAWKFYEWDCRQIGLTPPRWTNWRTRVQQIGYGLMGLGVLGLAVGLGLI
jgi:hypothetical protein